MRSLYGISCVHVLTVLIKEISMYLIICTCSLVHGLITVQDSAFTCSCCGLYIYSNYGHVPVLIINAYMCKYQYICELPVALIVMSFTLCLL